MNGCRERMSSRYVQGVIALTGTCRGKKRKEQEVKDAKKKSGISIDSILIGCLIAVMVAGGIGWIKNVVKLTSCDFSPPYKAELIHTAGIIPVVGAITGWMDFGE